MSTIAEKIKELRLENELTQPDLAKLVGVSNGTISFWENGLSTPRFNYVKKLAESLGTTLEFLLEETTLNNEPHREITGTISRDEELLLHAYRNMSAGKKKALFNMLDIDDSAIKKTSEND